MKRAAIIAPIVFVGCVAGWYLAWSPQQAASESFAHSESFESRDGRAETQADIEHGTPKWKVIGLERSDLERSVVLFDRLGVHLDRIADCVVDAPLLKYVETYNAEIRRHIALKHGASAIDVALSDADSMSYVRRRKKG
jgi:hypothetical protein